MPTPKQKPFQDFYLLFGLQQTATQTEIKTAYRELALKLHPDQNSSPEAHQQFLLLNEAYRILNNPNERNKYDLKYKHYYDPHKKSAGITERIEINRAKRASRYGRSMYSQRMRYRGRNTGGGGSRSAGPRNTYTKRESTYNWEAEAIDPEDNTYKKHASIVQILVTFLFLFNSYNLSDYFFRVLSERLAVVETVEQENGDMKVFARKYYYKSHSFYISPKNAEYFTPNTHVQLERSYFQGRLYQIRVHKDEGILLFSPTRAFFDYPFYILILIIVSSLACLLFSKNDQKTLQLGSLTFLLSIIWSLSV